MIACATLRDAARSTDPRSSRIREVFGDARRQSAAKIGRLIDRID
jgi:hypothetical protein